MAALNELIDKYNSYNHEEIADSIILNYSSFREENYIKTEKIDYSNMISDTGYNVGILIEKFMNKGIKKTVKILSSLFLD